MPVGGGLVNDISNITVTIIAIISSISNIPSPSLHPSCITCTQYYLSQYPLLIHHDSQLPTASAPKQLSNPLEGYLS